MYPYGRFFWALKLLYGNPFKAQVYTTNRYMDPSGFKKIFEATPKAHVVRRKTALDPHTLTWWSPLHFFWVMGSLKKSPPQKGCPHYHMGGFPEVVGALLEGNLLLGVYIKGPLRS